MQSPRTYETSPWAPVITAVEYERYSLWKQGINPNTHRRIKIGGPTHNSFITEFHYLDTLSSIDGEEYVFL